MSNKQGLVGMAQYIRRNAKAFRIYPLRDKSRTALTLANMKIGALDVTTATSASLNTDVYHTRVNEFNHAMIRHYQGKWYATKALSEDRKSALWSKAKDAFNEAIAIGIALQEKIGNGDTTPIPLSPLALTDNGAEIQFADEVPLVPDITPIVVLQGSSFEMGYQYAQQLVEIFGDWIMHQHAQRPFTDEETSELRCWEDEHRLHTPELLDFVRGWQGPTRWTFPCAMTTYWICGWGINHRPRLTSAAVTAACRNCHRWPALRWPPGAKPQKTASWWPERPVITI